MAGLGTIGHSSQKAPDGLEPISKLVHLLLMPVHFFSLAVAFVASDIGSDSDSMGHH